MTEYDNTNRFSLFRNERKAMDKHPDYTGIINVDGVDFFLDAWLKTGRDGKKFFSGSIKRKDRQAAPRDRDDAPARNARAPDRGSAPAPMDDNIPFAAEWR